MKLPRDLSGQDLAKALRKLGYGITRQTSSHIRLTTQRQGEHHVTIHRAPPQVEPGSIDPAPLWAKIAGPWMILR
jgi:predicted RNA binding protein YcfA (HicA-like mRNA interferase family)